MAPRTLRWYQEKALSFILSRNRVCGIFADLGTGKTLVAIRAVELPCLVVCRQDDFETWRRELIAEGVPADRIQFISSNAQSIHRGSWFITSYGIYINRKGRGKGS